LRPPWSSRHSIEERCTACGDCISACPENIIVADADGRPTIELERGECTFCGSCASICDHGVFSDTDMTPWDVVARIGDGCLNASGIGCQLCRDHCPTEALRLDLSIRPVGRIHVDAERCTGCGACLPSCPVKAIAMTGDNIGRPLDA
jgi:ferredoxin-type protein NapF